MHWLIAAVLMAASLAPPPSLSSTGHGDEQHVAAASAFVVAAAHRTPDAPRQLPVAWLGASSRSPGRGLDRAGGDRIEARSTGAHRSLREPMRVYGRRIPRVDDGVVPRA